MKQHGRHRLVVAGVVADVGAVQAPGAAVLPKQTVVAVSSPANVGVTHRHEPSAAPSSHGPSDRWRTAADNSRTAAGDPGKAAPRPRTPRCGCRPTARCFCSPCRGRRRAHRNLTERPTAEQLHLVVWTLLGGTGSWTNQLTLPQKWPELQPGGRTQFCFLCVWSE